jgi:hypothetical protein
MRGIMALTGLALASGWLAAAGYRSHAQPAPAHNVLTNAERQAGWRLLFDGKTTAGWRGYQEAAMRPDWRVIDGALTLNEGGVKHRGIVTVDQFDNFEFLVDWRLAEGGNSGIMYRVTEDRPEPHMTGPEVQLLDNVRHPDARISPTRTAGSCYDLYAPAKDVTRPPGQWNTLRLLANGNHVEHWLNGAKLVEYEIGSPDWQQRLAKSKWRTEPKYARNAKGHLCFQEHNSHVEFRNIKIRPLTPRRPGPGSS